MFIDMFILINIYSQSSLFWVGVKFFFKQYFSLGCVYHICKGKSRFVAPTYRPKKINILRVPKPKQIHDFFCVFLITSFTTKYNNLEDVAILLRLLNKQSSKKNVIWKTSRFKCLESCLLSTIAWVRGYSKTSLTRQGR